MRNWSFVAINTICSKIASVTPNLAYVSDAPLPGKTQKACRRELGRFGGETWISDGGHSWLTIGAYRSKALSVVKPHEELLPLENQHPLRQLLANPNPVDTSFDLQYEQQMFEELCGVSYLWAVPNKFGVPCELWVLPSHWVWPRTGGRLPAEMWGGGGHGVARLQEPMWDGGQEVGDGARWGARYVDPLDAHFDELIAYYEVRPWGGMGSAGTLRLPPNEVIMTRWKSPLNKIDGYSKLAAVAQWIDTEESISASRWAQFINQARPELWVELGQGYEDPDINEIARIEAKFAAKLQGEYNYGKPLITPPGAKVTALSFTPTEMAYFQCLDTETECLTAEGWKRFDELSLDTRVACYDAETKTIVYNQPSKVTVQDYSGTMYRWEGDRVDALMTPNHRVHVRRPTTKAAGGELVEKVMPYRGSQRVQLCRIGRKNLNEKVWCVKRVEELAAKTTYGILGGAKAACDAPTAVAIEHFEGWRQREQLEDYSIAAEVWLRFLGYYLSEGCIHKRSDPAYKDGREIDITQKKHVDSFRQGIESTPFRWKDHVSQNGCTHWRTADKGLVAHLTEHCGTNSFNKRVPNYVKAWPAEQLEVLLLALLEGDGSALRYSEHGRGKPANHETSWSSQYYTSSRQLADDVQELAVKCGCTASITEKMDQREEFLGRPRYTVNISSRAILDVTPDMRSEVQYSGKVWCVTVPTGLFVVRRNGKAHVTGNSEDQIRDMILAAFQVPKSAVGIGEGMTYGSILATLAQLCTTCLNPRLAMRGLTLTKHLASRWRDRRGESTVRIWWDDCVPADPTQVNSDISQDVQVYAITPNEVRAIRGRKPYAHGGDDPMGQGPGGIMPIPLNTGEGLEDLAELIAPMKEQPGGEGEGQPGMPGAEAGAGPGEAGGDPGAGEGEAGDPMVAGGGPTSNAQNERTQGMEPARVDNPNGAPEGLEDEAPKKSWEIRKSLPPYSWCSTQFDLTDETLVEALRSCPILEEDLVGDGREQQPHITVRYGLEESNQQAVQELLRGFGPVRVRLGKTNYFPADEGRPDSDVVYLEVEGEALYRLHQRLLQLPGKPDDRPYTPHVTLAYVAPGKGEFYKGDDSLEDSLLVLDQLTVTDQQGAGHTVDLRRMVQPARKGLVWKAKGGPCEQGETAANTGCTPAEGGGGGSSKPHSNPQGEKRTRAGEVLKPTTYDAASGQWLIDGKPAPPHIQQLGLIKPGPRGWTDVYANPDPKGTLLACGTDQKGRVQSKYSATHAAKQAAKKFARTSALIKKRAQIRKELERDAQRPELKDSAECLAVVMATGMRPGSEHDTGADYPSYGATTLEGRHVLPQKDGSVILRLVTGKNKGREVDFPVRDPAVARMLLARAQEAGSSGKLFPNTDAGKLRHYSKSKDGGGFKTKDHRTALGTETAMAAMAELEPPTSKKAYKAAVKAVAERAAKQLGNTAAVCLKSYIDPSIWASWKQAAGVHDD